MSEHNLARDYTTQDTESLLLTLQSQWTHASNLLKSSHHITKELKPVIIFLVKERRITLTQIAKLLGVNKTRISFILREGVNG